MSVYENTLNTQIIKKYRGNSMIGLEQTENQWFEAILNSKVIGPKGEIYIDLPTFPSETIQSNTTGQAGKGTLLIGFEFYKNVISTLTSLNSRLCSSHKLLDFGVGWGRICRFFMRELPLVNIYGLDVNKELIDICNETFKSNNFSVCGIYPPTSFSDNSFNLITGYSVFSHLSEEACMRWIKEFYRVLVPGGIVAITTRSRDFFDYCEQLNGPDLIGYPLALSQMFDDFNKARARYDSGFFVHSNSEGVSGGGVLNKHFYGETFIPEEYAKTAYAEWFTLEKFVYEPGVIEHPIMYFKKR